MFIYMKVSFHHETEYTFTETSIFELLQAQDPLQGELVALQKDKAEMIEYAENIVGALDAIMLFGTDINIAKEFAKMALETKKPKCMECME